MSAVRAPLVNPTEKRACPAATATIASMATPHVETDPNASNATAPNCILGSRIKRLSSPSRSRKNAAMAPLDALAGMVPSALRPRSVWIADPVVRVPTALRMPV
jgi:hypothetical protein